MASRPRDKRRKNWPDYLHAKERNGPYYFWRHPDTGKEFGLGRDFADAAAQAIEANLNLRSLHADRRLVDRLATDGDGTVSEFLSVMREVLDDRGLAKNTNKTNTWKLKAIGEAIGSMVLDRVTTKDLSDRIIEPLIKANKRRSALAIRSMLIDMWAVAESKGWTKNRPADVLTIGTVEIKRSRLSLDQFKAVYAAAIDLPDAWIANMLALAIVTAQPRECLCEWEFSDVRDGFIWNERGKTGARIKVPLGLVVPELGWRLDDVVKRCRDTTLSRNLLHHTRSKTLSRPGDAIFIDTLTKGFARARDASGLVWKDKDPPSLHEVRSLALRLYKDNKGRDFAQALAGHKQGSTTDIYTDVRGSEWIEVKIG